MFAYLANPLLGAQRVPAYYNENEPFVVEWLKNLIAAGHIAPGDVDDRSIADVQADDLKGYEQYHFFAGIGGWSRALRLAGWPDDEPVWTGSCPCQPFSVAGKGSGVDDARHLWPVWRELIAKCAPPVVFGEQVASPLGRDWLASVRTKMEALGYGVGAADLCAASVGAPHIRQRLWWVADAENQRCTRSRASRNRRYGFTNSNTFSRTENDTTYSQRVRCDNHWRCESGVARMAHGVPNKVARVRAWANAIVPQVAQAFIEAYMDVRAA